jgi:hypothetical protein
MIAYDLRCSLAHGFEGWFASSTDYDAQLAAGLLRCPFCEDAVISKMITAPNVGRKGNQVAQSTQSEKAAQSESPSHSTPFNIQSPAETSEQPSLPNVTVPEGMAEMITKLAKLQNEVLKDSRWVGRKFADEARAMHYGEAEPQQIHGESSPQEARELADEGIAIAALPLPIIPPEAKN